MHVLGETQSQEADALRARDVIPFAAVAALGTTLLYEDVLPAPVPVEGSWGKSAALGVAGTLLLFGCIGLAANLVSRRIAG